MVAIISASTERKSPRGAGFRLQGEAIESPARDVLTLTKPPLDGKDKLTVLEVGDDFAFRPAGTSRLKVWLQRHR